MAISGCAKGIVMENSNHLESSPLISVVVPTYNSSRWLPELVETIRAQKGVRTEIILVDNESEDDTVAQIKRDYGTLVRLRYSFSVRVSRLIGVHAAAGEYVAFLDHDDLWAPDKLEKQLNLLQSNPEIFAIGTAHAEFTQSPEKANMVDWPEVNQENLPLIKRSRIESFHPSSMFMRTSDAKEVLLETLGLRPQDGAIIAESARRGKVVRLEEVLTFVRIIPESQMRKGLIDWSESRRRTWFVLNDPDIKNWISEREYSEKYVSKGDRRNLRSQYLEVRAESYLKSGDRFKSLFFGLQSKLYIQGLQTARMLRRIARSR